MTDLNPRIPQYLAVAAMSAASLGRTEDAAALGEAATLAAPDSHNVKLVKGISLVRSGEAAEGATYLRKAVLDDTPDDATAMFYVGLAEHRLGNGSARDSLWDKLMDGDDSDPQIKSFQDMIQEQLNGE